MIRSNFIKSAGVIFLIFYISIIAGCGGGRATSSTSEASPSGSPVYGNGGVVLNWIPPTTYVDGSALTNLAGHNIYINTGTGYTKFISIDNPSISTYVVDTLSPGVYSFVITAIDSKGVESSFSNERIVTISS